MVISSIKLVIIVISLAFRRFLLLISNLATISETIFKNESKSPGGRARSRNEIQGGRARRPGNPEGR